MKVKCPWCGDPAEDLVDSAELLDLLQKVTKLGPHWAENNSTWRALLEYLSSGDPGPLRKLAGE